MIRPGGFRGAVFGTALEGNARDDIARRRKMADDLGISRDWAWVLQVHGAVVAEVEDPGSGGEADAIVTSVPGLPVTITTADCVPVVLEGDEVTAAVHAGWRGTAAGVIEATLEHLDARGTPPRRAAIGPSIEPCCYEVGPEVVQQFPGHVSTTEGGELSVDLQGAIAAKLAHLELWRSGTCTFTSASLHSHRRDRSMQRQVAVAWMPTATAR